MKSELDFNIAISQNIKARLKVTKQGKQNKKYTIGTTSN